LRTIARIRLFEESVCFHQYDERNRIARWTKDGQGHDFGYDDLGNLTLYAGEPQIYDDERPYAIVRRDLEVDVQYSYDADGNVISIVGGPTPQHFAYDSANRTVCLGSSAGSCSTRVAYDVSGKRVAEYWTGTAGYMVYVGDDFVWEDRLTGFMANVEVRLGDQRIALKRFQASRRGSGAGAFSIALPVEWGVGGGLVVVVVLLLGARRGGHLVLVYRRPIRAASAVGSALSLFMPHVAVAGGIPLGSSPSYYWEIADPLGTGMVMLDEEGARVRHQTFSPFGRVGSVQLQDPLAQGSRRHAESRPAVPMGGSRGWLSSFHPVPVMRLSWRSSVAWTGAIGSPKGAVQMSRALSLTDA
jgi:hypothetical protein